MRRAQSRDWTQDSAGTIDAALAVRYPWLTDPSLETPSMGEDTFAALSRAMHTSALLITRGV
ncbi:MAG: hypothetical protein IPG06_02325 [Haliea sp.]|nr:hypothetical protein [Haliea sp.]